MLFPLAQGIFPLLLQDPWFPLSLALAIFLVLLGLLLPLKKPRRRWKLLLALTGLLALFGLGVLSATDPFFDQEPLFVENAVLEKSTASQSPLSEDQEQFLSEHGPPQSFVLLFTKEGRQEQWLAADGSWTYFLGGDQVGLSTESVSAPLTTALLPWSFSTEMSPADALSIAGAKTFTQVPVEDGTLYFCDQAVFGFHKDNLYYVETTTGEVPLP